MKQAGLRTIFLAGAALAMLGCGDSGTRRQGSPDTTLAQGAAQDSTVLTATPVDSSASTRLPIAEVRLEVDVNARQLHLYHGPTLLVTHPVAVGSPEWPTRTGEWHVSQVIWNPEWIPPDESWAEERKPQKPGDPANPLGRAQLIYDPPRSIHGTNDSTSIGKAVSHGRSASNEVAIQLARQLMEVTARGRTRMVSSGTGKADGQADHRSPPAGPDTRLLTCAVMVVARWRWEKRRPCRHCRTRIEGSCASARCSALVTTRRTHPSRAAQSRAAATSALPIPVPRADAVVTRAVM